MKSEISIEQLLRWRLAQAEAEAPPAPRAARLIERSRPWWERWPAQFLAVTNRLHLVPQALGHAMDEPGQDRCGHPVPVMLVVGNEQTLGEARMLYLSVRQCQLRLRFQVDELVQPPAQAMEVTFVCQASLRPVALGHATPSVEGQFRVEAELPPEVARIWERLKVTDRMPFRFILRAETQDV